MPPVRLQLLTVVLALTLVSLAVAHSPLLEAHLRKQQLEDALAKQQSMRLNKLQTIANAANGAKQKEQPKSMAPLSFPVVETTLGLVRGFTSGSVRHFLGIPFAAAPVGENRFKPPRPHHGWNGTRDVMSDPPACPQLRVVGDLHLGSEDCLFLNVWVPDSHDPSKDPPLPVLFWIYGGGFVFGDSIEFGFYEGSALANKHNVIVVSHNYRVGVFGFLAHPALMNESPERTTGGYGIQDQRAALEFVNSNIKAFGGDPDRVTIFGESAGAFSVCVHYVTSQGLFSHAIMESGTCSSPDFFVPLDKAESWGELYTSSIGCNASELDSDAEFLDCVRNKSTVELMKTVLSWLDPKWPLTGGTTAAWAKLSAQAQLDGYVLPRIAPIMPWGVAIDGSPYGLPDLPLDMIKRNNFTRMPLIIGTNNNEGSIFVPALPLVVRNGTVWPTNEDTLVKALEHFFNASTVDAILDMYPEADFASPGARCSRILRDFVFVCPSRDAARAVAAHGVDAFVYHFAYKLDWIEYLVFGDYHTSELPFVFSNEWPPFLHTFSADDWKVSDIFGTYWTNFAKYGNPNGNNTNSAPMTWPSYLDESRKDLVIALPLGVEDMYEETQCELWDTVVETQ